MLHVHSRFFLFEKAFRSAVEAQHTHHVCCLLSLRVSKHTFYWEDLRCQDLDGGFRMSNKSYCIYRISKKKWEVPFGGSRSQQVIARVGPWEPGLGLNARSHARAWCCMCTSFLFLQKDFRSAVEAQHTHRVCCLMCVYLVVLL